MRCVLIITILEAIFHLLLVCPLSWMVFDGNMWLQLGIIIPLALATVIRLIAMSIAVKRTLDFFARERSLIIYSVTVLVEWSILIVWFVKLYKTILTDCEVH